MNSETLVITISRQYGSGGSYLGKLLAKKLGFKYFDREILRQATEYLGTDEADLSEREEKLSGFLEKMSRILLHGSPEAAYLQPPIRPVYDRDIYETESRIITGIAEKHNAVVVGRCGFHILRGHPGLINVFVHAPIAFRVKRIMRTYAITGENEAFATVVEMDKRRERFVNSMTGVEWTDALNYHLSFESALSGFEAGEQMILKLVATVRDTLSP
jgi:cytidylate kinase